MQPGETLSINDYLNKEICSCPLKLKFYSESAESNGKNVLPYKAAIKLIYRDVIAGFYPAGHHTSDDHFSAEQETFGWLKKKNTVVYGALLRDEPFVSRIPILVKEDNRFTVVQIHGKMWNPAGRPIEVQARRNHGVAHYVREAAFRGHILNTQFPDADIHYELWFPNRKYKSAIENLFREVTAGNALNDNLKDELQSLFVKVNADQAVNELKVNPSLHLSHPEMNQSGWNAHIEKIRRVASGDDEMEWVHHAACKNCVFRQPDPSRNFDGCWFSNIPQKPQNPELDVYNLIGHGNDQDAVKGFYFQEDVPLSPGMDTFDKILDYSGNTISIQQRRALQLLSAHGKKIPTEWMKDSLRTVLEKLTYPLHCLDFEAATCALPMETGVTAYEPVLFQYSCYTLYDDGRLVHTRWLDSDPYEFPHHRFAQALLDIPDIYEGTIIQYSPFERQAIKNLHLKFERGRFQNEKITQDLEKLLKPNDHDRFLDLNRVIRDFYYNSFITNGLGLKQSFFGILNSSNHLKEKYASPVELGDSSIRLVNSQNRNLPFDPYKEIAGDLPIYDGSSAMNAWLLIKAGKITGDEKEATERALVGYNTLDSLALAMILEHLFELIYTHPDPGDILIFDGD